MVAPYYADDTVTLHLGDCREVLTGLADGSVDGIVTDPPYGLEFMGKEWDTFKPGGKRPGFGKPDGSKYRQNHGTPSWGATGNPTCRTCGGDKYRNGDRKCRCAAPDFGNHMAQQMRAFQAWCEGWAMECLRVLKPGGHMLAFGGARTYHRLTCAMEDAGFEIRDSLMWVYGSGFPKSLDVGKSIARADGAAGGLRIWDGWGTALKPAHEPIVVARKPLAGTVAGNVLKHGTGALNIDGCRVGISACDLERLQGKDGNVTGVDDGRGVYGPGARKPHGNPAGRWPSNLVFSHLPECGPDDSGQCAEGCPVVELDRQSGHLKSGANPTRRRADELRDAYGNFRGQETCTPARGADDGGASRFFPVFRYEPKAPAHERPRLPDGTAHTTVKPVNLMRWIVRLITPPGGLVLDPFAGSGSTGEACVIEGFRAVLIEQDPAHAELIKVRLSKPVQPSLGFDVPG